MGYLYVTVVATGMEVERLLKKISALIDTVKRADGTADTILTDIEARISSG
jgi:hypothetical protein